MKLIDTQLGGTTPLDIILNFENDELFLITNTNEAEDDDLEFEDDIFEDDIFTNDQNIWFTKNKIETIKNIHKYLENRKEIGKVTSIYSLIDVANKINGSELTTFELSVLYKEIPNKYKEDLIYLILKLLN